MKLALAKSNRSQRGSALILALITGTIIGIVLASYLGLVQSRMYARARSFSWNSAIPVLEAGIEEGFTTFRDDSGNLTANGWGTTNSTYTRRRDFSDGSYCLITISNAIVFPYTAPVIYSQGFVPAPLGKGYISRKVQVTVTNANVFTKGIAAKGTVDLNGQSIVDSYDSSSTNFSTGGRYDVAKRRGNGGVVTDSNANPAVDTGNGHIYGMVDTGPTGTAAGNIGDLAWSSGIESGYVSHDFNASFPDVSAPASLSWVAPDTGAGAYGLGAGNGFSYGGNTYDYLLGNVSNKYTGSFSLKNDMLVTGNATLYITGDFTINGGGSVIITNGGSLTIYVGGNTTINGGGVINATGYATNFTYYGLSTSTQLKYAGNSSFVGTVYAPEADFILTGGAQYFGAAVVNTYVSKSAGAGFHYDESLAYRGNFKLLSYREL